MIRELYQFEYQPGVRFAFSAPEHFQGTTLRRIVDTATGVLYLQAITDQGISITPLLEVDGEPLVQDPYLRVQLDALSDWKGISRILEAMKSRKYWYQDGGEEKSTPVRAWDPTSTEGLLELRPGGYYDCILSDGCSRSVRIYPWDPNTRQGGYLEVEVQEDGGLDAVMELPICAGGKPLGVVCED